MQVIFLFLLFFGYWFINIVYLLKETTLLLILYIKFAFVCFYSISFCYGLSYFLPSAYMELGLLFFCNCLKGHNLCVYDFFYSFLMQEFGAIPFQLTTAFIVSCRIW